MALHLYTTDIKERENLINNFGWVEEGPVGFVPTQPVMLPGVRSVPVARFFNKQNGDHFYTTSVQGEIISAQKLGWALESNNSFLLLIGLPFDFENLPLSPQFYRFNKVGNHFYTSDPKEATKVQSEGYQREDLDGGFGDGVSTAMVLKKSSPTKHDATVSAASRMTGQAYGVLQHALTALLNCAGVIFLPQRFEA